MGVVCKTTESSGDSCSSAQMRLCTPEPGLLDSEKETAWKDGSGVSRAVLENAFASLCCKKWLEVGRREAEIFA